LSGLVQRQDGQVLKRLAFGIKRRPDEDLRCARRSDLRCRQGRSLSRRRCRRGPRRCTCSGALLSRRRAHAPICVDRFTNTTGTLPNVPYPQPSMGRTIRRQFRERLVDFDQLAIGRLLSTLLVEHLCFRLQQLQI
jgi:hypothetical protein